MALLVGVNGICTPPVAGAYYFNNTDIHGNPLFQCLTLLLYLTFQPGLGSSQWVIGTAPNLISTSDTSTLFYLPAISDPWNPSGVYTPNSGSVGSPAVGRVTGGPIVGRVFTPGMVIGQAVNL